MKIIMKVMSCILLVALLSGCANMAIHDDPRDPLERLNRSTYNFNAAMDNALFNPIISIYQALTPDFLDRGISNFFSNINEILVIINDILQFKFGQAMSDFARFAMNSTFGLLGFFDVSTSMGLPKHNEDFGQTLAKWGFGSGPYLVLPFLGPSTIRDAAGYGAETAVVSPFSYLSNPAHQAGLLSLNYVDYKADMLGAADLIAEAALDEYEFTKNAYLNRRENLIHDRESGPEEFEDFEGFEDFDDPAIFPESP